MRAAQASRPSTRISQSPRRSTSPRTSSSAGRPEGEDLSGWPCACWRSGRCAAKPRATCRSSRSASNRCGSPSRTSPAASGRGWRGGGAPPGGGRGGGQKGGGPRGEPPGGGGGGGGGAPGGERGPGGAGTGAAPPGGGGEREPRKVWVFFPRVRDRALPVILI